MADALTRGTAWLAMGCLALAIAVCAANATARKRGERIACWMWTLGCVVLWIHVGCAFHFHHHWSQAAAYAHTAEQTAAVTGIAWGGGLYINYLLMLVWTGDVFWWWLAPLSYRARPDALRRVIRGFAVFMAFNATVVFGSGRARWIALAAFVGMAVLSRTRTTTSGPAPR